MIHVLLDLVGADAVANNQGADARRDGGGDAISGSRRGRLLDSSITDELIPANAIGGRASF
jgi:hypothetical protein